MRTALISVAALVLIVPCNAIAGQEASLCPGIELGGSNPSEVDQYYALQTIEIVKFAKREDASSLANLIAPDAKFDLWRGDYTTSARDSGPKGFIKLVRDLKPEHFQSRSRKSGPITTLGTADCRWSVRILFRGDDARSNVEMTIIFRDGLLVAAEGHEVTLIEGNVR